jgi:hypothetical protein
MNAETDAFYGRPDPSKTYKWGLVLPMVIGPPARLEQWRVVAWFPTRTNAEAYAKRVHGQQPHAIARATNL